MPNNIPDSTQAFYSRLAPSKASEQEYYGQWAGRVRIEQGIVYLHTIHCPSCTQKARKRLRTSKSLLIIYRNSGFMKYFMAKSSPTNSARPPVK
jgi:hypothetical protein